MMKCTFCENNAVVQVLSMELAHVELCQAHWAEYRDQPQGEVSMQVDKILDDGIDGRLMDTTPAHYGYHRSTKQLTQCPPAYTVKEEQSRV